MSDNENVTNETDVTNVTNETDVQSAPSGNKKPTNKDYLKTQIYTDEKFSSTVKLKEIITGQFVKCEFDTLILEGITTLKNPFKSCKIKKIKFVNSIPISPESQYAFYGQGIEEVEIPETLKDNFLKNGSSMFPYSKIVFYK
jgi:hypothetical protein